MGPLAHPSWMKYQRVFVVHGGDYTDWMRSVFFGSEDDSESKTIILPEFWFFLMKPGASREHPCASSHHMAQELV